MAKSSKTEAIFLLSQLITFVTNNPGVFDLKFASEFNKVRDIASGSWSASLSSDFEIFKLYLAQFPKFKKYLEEEKERKKLEQLAKIADLRWTLDENCKLLTVWGSKNVLDPKAAEIAETCNLVKLKDNQKIDKLRELLNESNKLLSATGIANTANQAQIAKAEQKQNNECSVKNIEICTKIELCSNATLLSNGIRRWNLEQSDYVSKARELGLNCEVSSDQTPYSETEAQYLLIELVIRPDRRLQSVVNC